jgi:D-sedoheptulose 7-phosphate isomerase
MLPTLEVWKMGLTEARDVATQFVSDPSQLEKCQKFTQLLLETFNNGGNAFSCGNGGSHCDAMHFAEEWTGRYRKDRKAMGALALGDPSHVTCVSNDFGFKEIFARQLAGLGRKGDILIGISTSGNSENVIRAFEVAKEKGIKTVALLGKDGGKMKNLVDLSIIVPAQTADRIQEMHIKIIHLVIEAVERQLFPQNY